MTTVPLSQAKTHLARLLSEAEELGEHVLITRSGRPAGVLVPVDEYEGLAETLDILADPELPQAIRQGQTEIDSGDVVSHEAL